MPNASSADTVSWSNEEYTNLIELVKQNPTLYNEQDTSRKNILTRESTWEQISQKLDKPVEDCKKRWRILKDSYMRALRTGSIIDKAKMDALSKLDFLSSSDLIKNEETIEQQVILDNQEYYEITLVDEDSSSQENKSRKLPIKIVERTDEPPKKIGRKNCGRKKYVPCQASTLPPIKILPKPVTLNGPKIIHYVEEPKATPAPAPSQPQKSEVLDKLIEKVLKEHTNEIDVFFRSMAASVKKLQPNLIPKVKMEVCNVIAKYEMQSFEKNGGL